MKNDVAMILFFVLIKDVEKLLKGLFSFHQKQNIIEETEENVQAEV